MKFLIETCTCGLVCIALLFVVTVVVVLVIPTITSKFNISFSISRFNLVPFYNLIVVVLTTTLAVLGALSIFILRSYYTPEEQFGFIKNVTCLAFYGGAAIITAIMGVLIKGVFNKISTVIFFYVCLLSIFFLIYLFVLSFNYLKLYMGYFV